MKGFLFLGAGAFLAGAVAAVMMDRRSGLDEEYGEDPNWPGVPYTAATHPDSPQEHVTGSAEAAPSPAIVEVLPADDRSNGTAAETVGPATNASRDGSPPAAARD